MTKGISHRRREKASIKTAIKLLEKEGFIIEDTNVKVERNDKEIGEIDILAKDSEGNCWAVEVKSGYADINGVRQTYVNSVITGCKPMLIARTYSNEDVLELAEELGVELKFFQDLFVTDPIEFKVYLDESVETASLKFFEILDCLHQISPRAEFLLRIMATDSEAYSFGVIEDLLNEMPCLREFIKDKKSATRISRLILVLKTIRMG